MNDDEQYRSLARKLADESRSAPAHLEATIVKRLTREGKIRSARTSHFRHWLQGMAAAAMFIAGFGAAYLYQMPRAKSDDTYMLLLFNGEHFNPPNQGSLRTAHSEWMKSVRGVEVIAGEELQAEGILISDEGLSLKNRASGFFIVRASSADKVVEIAKTNPHARYGGIIEIKKVLQ